MKKLSTRLLSLILLFLNAFLATPAESAETLTLPCGPNGETYQVIMPAGIAISGTQCTGPLEIDSRVKIIDQQAFRSINLISVVIPNSVTIIGSAAFEGTKLNEIIIPNSVKTIGSHAFSSTGNLTSIKLPDSQVELDANVFANSGIESVIIPNSFSKLSKGMFSNTNLKTISIPTSVKTIEWSALSNTKLTSLVIPSSVDEIQNRAFEGNLYLTTVSVPDSLRVIGDNVFDRNYSLTSILYCGKLTGFPINPTCPPERKALMDAKPADSQLISDPRKVYVDQLSSKLSALLKSKPDLKKVIQKTQNSLNLINLSSSASDYSFKQEILLIERQIQALEKLTSITCTKGKVSKKVTAVKPKCPTGYKKR